MASGGGHGTASLRKLSDTDLTVADPAEDVRGRKVLDRRGDEVGEVDDLLIDDRQHRVRFLRVASGGFLGLGETKTLVPVDAVTALDGQAVHIDRTREHVAGAPAYDPDLTYDQDYYGGLYGYYGYGPFWAAGYAYPAFPILGPPVTPVPPAASPRPGPRS
jgi:sporulation protein YlmC with PRC-barrel domain